MQTITTIQSCIARQGFAVVNNVFTSEEVNALITHITGTTNNSPNFRNAGGLFAIRQFIKEMPGIEPLIFTPTLKTFISDVFGNDYFVVKGIYFDKPGESNWFVGWHQDLTISVNQKLDIEGFGPWTVKHNQFAVQPPLAILEDNFTLRVHLDDTDENNGALKVLPGSHLLGVWRPGDKTDYLAEQTCRVNSGGVMFMKPLLIHASGRTTNNKKRRVLHIEFSRSILPEGLQWAEKAEL